MKFDFLLLAIKVDQLSLPLSLKFPHLINIFALDRNSVSLIFFDG